MKKLKTKMQTFIYEDKEYQYPDMQDANDALPLEDGAWLEEPNRKETWRWHVGNFFD
jgi:hypothetical protein